MGKNVFIFFITNVAVNGWWYCATQESIVETPLVLIPIIATAGSGSFAFRWVIKNWE